MEAGAIPPYTVPNPGANVCWQVNIIEAFCVGYGKKLLLDSIEANFCKSKGPQSDRETSPPVLCLGVPDDRTGISPLSYPWGLLSASNTNDESNEWPAPKMVCQSLGFISPSHENVRSKVTKGKNKEPFLTDVKALRERARKSIEKGAVTHNYGGDVQQTIDILQAVLATEIVCVLRYTMHAVSASGISSDSVKEEFAQHAKEEQEHMMAVAERINQLGGKPNFNPEGLASRSASQYTEGENLIGMIRENLIAERIAVEHYRELILFFGDKDTTTRVMLEHILGNEEEHANDMHDLLVAHEGRPMLPNE